MSNNIPAGVGLLIKAAKRKIFAAVAVKVFLTAGPLLFFTAGTVNIICRYSGMNIPFLNLALLLSAVILALAAAMLKAFRVLPPEANILAMLDSRCANGGFLSAVAEADLGEWEQGIELPASPAFRCKSGSKPLILILSAGFVIGSCLVPVTSRTGPGSHRMDITEDLNKVEEQVNLLQEQNLITEQEKRDFDEQLKNIAATADAEDPTKTWEALDHVNRTSLEKARLAEENALKALENLALLEKTAQLLSQAETSVSPEKFADGLKGFEGLLGNLCRNNPELEKMLKDACSGKSMSVGDLKKLMEKCKMSEQQLKQMLEKARQCGMLKDGNCNSGSAAGISNDELKDFLKKNGCTADSDGLTGLCLTPGDGDTSRGRGDAPLTTQERGLKHDGKYKDISLPPPGISSLKDSQLLGTSYGTPEAKPGGYTAPGQLSASGVSGGEMEKMEIQPKHRQAVSRYFGRGEAAVEHKK